MKVEKKTIPTFSIAELTEDEYNTIVTALQRLRSHQTFRSSAPTHLDREVSDRLYLELATVTRDYEEEEDRDDE